ncbi:MAG: murein L,D-transpeptidase [Deltaproteobacteria bacterium]|nr:murein L,D-transpeptidase [Deltaproteobacteria bacterium]
MLKKNHPKIFILLALMTLFLNYPSASAQVPTSPRAQEASRRVTPQLKKDFSKKGLTLGSPIFIRIFKEEKELELWVKDDQSFKLFKTYPICTYGLGTLGPKTKKGDGQAPEGFYFVGPQQLNPNSQFHLSFNLGYPNAYDRAYVRTGSALMVHGNCVSIGCYAMTDEKIEEIYTISQAALKKGQDFFRVHIFPFKMTQENLKRHQASPWYNFWTNLKEGYDFFEKDKKSPPEVKVKNKKYVFEKENN